MAENPLGYYAYDAGDWRVLVVNSNCQPAGGCDEGSSQYSWLQEQLDAAPQCTLAYWHHPRFASGLHGHDESIDAIWDLLYENGLDVVLSGHDHHYERFAPIDGDGHIDEERGIRQFIVGTGGGVQYPVLNRSEGTEVIDPDTYGVAKLTLHSDSYDWEFVPVEGESFTDSGSDICH